MGKQKAGEGNLGMPRSYEGLSSHGKAWNLLFFSPDSPILRSIVSPPDRLLVAICGENAGNVAV